MNTTTFIIGLALVAAITWFGLSTLAMAAGLVAL